MSNDVSDNIAPLDPETVLPDAVLDDIAEQLGLQPFSDNVRKDLRSTVRRYSFYQRIFGSHEANRKAATADYKSFKETVSEFCAFLEQQDQDNLASDLHFAALHRNAPLPETNFPEIADFEKTNGTPYLLELKRLLSLLEYATDLGLEKSAVPRGRKPNHTLESLVRRLAYVWEELLDQKFTIDYHKGSGLTPAFEFVRLVLERIIPDIGETEIVTAMRTIVSKLNQKAPNPSQE
ncbi:hypothetical protein L53_12920 [Hyphomonas sp. L-53-1-40]|uniref:hypothetical protein n=1 Tax=Hyphomonas sp. L-53-1-40 TaxID=1207058 RepID=UPI000458FF83|nr:hypothetical protein [Hyphomonas sp. L-53-1-40]KCZ62142.1 hypothetical protein L53_12920 [Hyphomonas sp. L-53-1-40]